MAYTEKKCSSCGATFFGTQNMEYCSDCRKIKYSYRKTKAIGDPDICEICGKEYIRTASNQRYCKECGEKNSKQIATNAKAKYNKSAYDRLELRVAKGDKQRILDHAEKQGESLNQFLNRAVNNQIAEDNKSTTD